jgi:hypothetical protein
VEYRAPTLVAGEDLVPVEQHQFVGVCPNQIDIAHAETVGAEHPTIGLQHVPAVSGRVGQNPQGRADHRQPVLTGDMIQRALRQPLRPVRGLELDRCMWLGERRHGKDLLVDASVNKSAG